MGISDEAFKLEDWKMTKDRIKHFDDVLMRTRVEGIPIATALQAAAFVTAKDVGYIQTKIPFIGDPISLPVFSLIILASLAYLVPVLLLDILHFVLLKKAVEHAYDLEKQLGNKIQITHKLTSFWLTLLHTVGAYLIYGMIFAAGIYFAFFGANEILTPLKTLATGGH